MREEKKKNYEKPQIECIKISDEDILTVSGFKDWNDVPEGDN